jgi:hypothetical protein
MPLRAFLLRCLLALALVSGGLPTLGTGTTVAVDDQAAAMTNCHDLVAPDSPSAEAAECCGGVDCRCDCLQHMPGAALAAPTLTTAVLPARVPAPRLLERSSHLSSTTLRPPIG